MNDSREGASHDSPEETLAVPDERDILEPLSLQLIAKRFTKLFWQGAALLGACVLLLTVGTGTAGWYTSRSQFCNSCHIMEPYYTSWQESSHKDVACTKCHFPPGVAEKARGKVLGLLQLAKYVTQTQGPRPVAEIPDASCLRSGCHETRLLSGRVDFKGIAFDHGKHLGHLSQGIELRCTSCHSQIVQGAHMTVTESTCFLCHFKNGHFNEGLGACTRCHQIPETEFDLGGGVKFDHNLAYEQGVDCQSCHSDLIRGQGEVPQERCTVCHNRPDDLKRYQDGPFLHKTHVSDHKVDCTMCHLEVHHSLDADLFTHAVSQCANCHPNQHQQQVAMLEGTGARLIPQYQSTMAAARLSCFTCHQRKEVSDVGTVLMKASLQTCIGCHAAEEISGLQLYHDQLRELLVKLESDVGTIQTTIDDATLEPERRAALSQRLLDLQHDVRFLHAGNDIHNSHYASELTAKLVEELTALYRDLQLDPPDVQLPESPKRVSGQIDGGADQDETSAEQTGTLAEPNENPEPSGKE